MNLIALSLVPIDPTAQEIVIGIISTFTVSSLALGSSWVRSRVRGSIGQWRTRRAEHSFTGRVLAEGVSNFYVGRREWSQYRVPPDLSDYLRYAQSSIQIACYWMAQGTLEGVPRVCAELASRGVHVEFALIDPDSTLPEALSADLDCPPEVIRQHVRSSIGSLLQLRERLASEARANYRVKVSSTLPQAAVILMDAGTRRGKIQLEFRCYGAPRAQSFSLEVSAIAGSNLYEMLETAWMLFFRDASQVPAPMLP